MSSTPIRSTAQGGPQPYIQIGTQNWQRRNLDVDHYRNGDIIPQVTDQTQWANLTTGAWCYYNNDPANGDIYGKLYNWYAVNDPRGLAPQGWHIPTDTEWTNLSTFLGGNSIAGGLLKETGISHWQSPNIGATNSSGFTALPGGDRRLDTFYDIMIFGTWWSATEYNAGNGLLRYIYYNNSNFAAFNYSKKWGMSIRCIKD